jgi:hypothetical protein
MEVLMSAYQDYAEASRHIKVLEGVLKKLRPRILGYVSLAGGKITNNFGTFMSVDYPTYQYSDAVVVLEEQLAKAKSLERESGVAVKITTPVLRYNNK